MNNGTTSCLKTREREGEGERDSNKGCIGLYLEISCKCKNKLECQKTTGANSVQRTSSVLVFNSHQKY